ncbi:molybdopterin cofactor-binding domain-containing protein [Candidatus Riflebacteria bacterium]
MKNIDSIPHVRGETQYVDDIPVREGTLFAVPFCSPVTHGKIVSLNLSAAKEMEGVAGVFTAADIPGENQIGNIIRDEILLPEGEVHFRNQPIALVVARTETLARKAAAKIKAEFEELPVIVEPRVAKEKGHFLCPTRTFSIGDAESAWEQCKHIFEGSGKIDGQEHIYLETQAAYAFPEENGRIKLHAGTQAPCAVQKHVACILGIPMHMVEVDTLRLGGAFGGKEDQATVWGCMAALACQLLRKPVKAVLSRSDDFLITGKRHPYEFDFKIGLDADLKIKAYEVELFQNGGAAADLSSAIMERTLFHAGGSYFLPNANITVYSCKTNLPPNTAFRGFGAPQGTFALESAIAKAAIELGVDKSKIQKLNLLSEGDNFSFGQATKRCNALKCWETAEKEFEFERLKKEAAEFNSKNSLQKKGVAIHPLCFGISFTKTNLNQGRSLVHLYTDGSVSISTGVIEMGQAVNTKILQVAAQTLSISPDRIKINSTNTSRIANASPTAASSGADLNGGATRVACLKLVKRLKEVAAKAIPCCDPSRIKLKDERVFVDGNPTDIEWVQLLQLAFEDRACLSEHGHYATPHLYFDKTREKGVPFAYHVYGTAVTGVTVDCILGTYEVDFIRIVHDFGKSINLDIDIGQVEGAVAMGIGLFTIEELLINEVGRFVYSNLSAYKVPDIYSAPTDVIVKPLDSEPNPMAILGSKAVGEPPFLYGMSAYFAILAAMREYNDKLPLELWAPMTHQKTLTTLYAGSGLVEKYGSIKPIL